MLYFLDTNIVVYLVAGQPSFQQRARDHIAALEGVGSSFAISELTWTECLVTPHRNGTGPLLLDYLRFLSRPNLRTISMSAAMYHRAATIRGVHNFGLADSLHLTAAVEAGCDRFLTNDQGLASFPDLTVELLS